MGVDRRDLNVFVDGDTKRELDIQHQMPRRTHLEHVEGDARPADANDDLIAPRRLGTWHRRPTWSRSISLVRAGRSVGVKCARRGEEDVVGKTSIEAPV